MISYRYHLVSVIGIFLAIALGVVIGTTALNGAVVGDLRRQVSDLKSQSANQSGQITSLTAQAGNADQIVNTFGARISAGALSKKAVVVLAGPGASTDVQNAVIAQIKAAGGTVSAQLQLTNDFVNPARASDIKALATSGAHPVGLQYPNTDDAGALAGSLLGWVLLGHGQATDLTQVLSGFGSLNMIKPLGATPAPGNAVVLISTGTLPAGGPGQTLLSMLGQLASPASGGPTVLAGDAASDIGGGVVALARANTAVNQTVSTVDNAGTAVGQLGTALALSQAIAKHVGQYGTGAGASSVLPGVSS